MPVYKKASTSDDIINGLVTVGTGGVPKHYDPGVPYTHRLASGDSVRQFEVLDTRYEVGPSGWSS